MKILMLSSSLRQGGAETHIYELALSLTKRGHRVVVATAGGALADALGEKGITHVKIPLDSKSPISLARSAKILRTLTKNERFDIIHTHSRIASFVCQMALDKRKNVVVSTVHSHFRLTPLLRRLSFWGRRSIAVSDDLCEYLCREYGIQRSKVSVIPNGIDTDKFSPSNKKRSNGLHILFASRLDADCSLGALLLCRIAPALAQRFEGLQIDIAGGGKEYRRLASLAECINSELGYRCINLCGHIKDMPRALCHADVFVGVSRAALEAMSAALPTVLCGNEGFLGILDSSNIDVAAKTNFCCRGSELPTSIGLFNALSTLLEMREGERHELGNYLRHYVIEHNSLSILAERTEEFYLSALSDMAEKSNVVVCGYYGFGNLGDDAMLSEIVKKLRLKWPQKSLCVVAHRPKGVLLPDGVKCISRENFGALKRKIREAEFLILGGGSILQDKSSLRSLVFYTSLIKYAHKHGTRVELWSNGLGPFKRKISKHLAAKALSRASKISLRDEISYSQALLFGIPRNKLTLEDDLSSGTSSCDGERVAEILKKLSLDNKSFALIGIKGKERKSVKRKIKKKLRALKEINVTPLFIVMHPSEDKRTARRYAKKFGGICADKLSPEELCGILPLAVSAIGTRYHLLYLAKRAGIPIIPFGDDPKILGL